MLAMMNASRDHRDPDGGRHRRRDPALAREDATVLAIVGAGVQARSHLRRCAR